MQRDPWLSLSRAIVHQNLQQTSGACAVRDAGDEGNHRQTVALIDRVLLS